MEDVKSYVKTTVMALSVFPALIVYRCADPRWGITAQPSQKYRPPNVADLSEWCRAEMARFNAALDRNEERRRVIEEREAAVVSPEETERRRQVVANLKAQLGEDWGLKDMSDPRPKAPKWGESAKTDKERADALLAKWAAGVADGSLTGLEIEA